MQAPSLQPAVAPCTGAFRKAATGKLLQASSSGLILWLVCLATYFLYQPALDAPWGFDDPPNLLALGQIRTLEDALLFVASGPAGALGRPLSLATFLINTMHWPTDPESIRHVNVCIHLLNGLLLAWLALRIVWIRPEGHSYEWAAVALAALWMLHPLLATTSLLAIQRMTLLAGTFVLVGLLLFVHGRALLSSRPGPGYAWMSLGLALGAGLGALAKENAALLPFLAAIVNAILLRHLPVGPRRLWITWRLFFFGGPAILLVLYIAVAWPSLIESYQNRPYGMEARLVNQAVILWEYVKQIVVPNIVIMGPFQDDVPVHGVRSTLVGAAVAAWLGLIGAAWRLRYRLPWFSFGVLWFVCGHLLESTLFNLELYFEHRNYIPAIGPLAATMALVARLSAPLARCLAGTLIVVMAALLWQVTTLWGDPLLAGERWAAVHPDSRRAAQYLAQQYAASGDVGTAARVIFEAADQYPKDADLALQAIQLACIYPAGLELVKRLKKADAWMAEFRPSTSIVTVTENLVRLHLQDECTQISREQLITLLTDLRESPGVGARPLVRHHLNKQLSILYSSIGRLNPAIYHLNQALDDAPLPETYLVLAGTFVSAGLFEEARAALGAAEAALSNDTITNAIWARRYASIRRAIEAKQDAAKRHNAGSQ